MKGNVSAMKEFVINVEVYMDKGKKYVYISEANSTGCKFPVEINHEAEDIAIAVRTYIENMR
jgi:hypothetical protein